MEKNKEHILRKLLYKWDNLPVTLESSVLQSAAFFGS